MICCTNRDCGEVWKSKRDIINLKKFDNCIIR